MTKSEPITALLVALCVALGAASLSPPPAAAAVPPLYATDFSSDPALDGWTGFAPAEWEWGPAAASSCGYDGSDPAEDTSAGFDNRLVGFHIGGCYGDDLPAIELRSPVWDFSGQVDLHLAFQRWLGVEGSAWDRARIDLSTDAGAAWRTVWANGSSMILDAAWTPIDLDLSAWADDQPAVQLRFIMGPTDSNVTFFGWNIDDLALTGGPRGYLEGKVEGPGGPLAGAVIRIVGTSYQAATGLDGLYHLDTIAGEHTVTAEAPGHNSATAAGVRIEPGLTTTRDFTLTAPEIDLDPTAISAEVPYGVSGSALLRILNLGNGPLAFTLAAQPAPDWLAIEPLAGQIAPLPDENFLDVKLTFDTIAAGPPGLYQAELLVASNDGDEPLLAVPVSLLVSGGGRLEGHVSDDRAPIAGAQVEIVELAIAATTGPDGFYASDGILPGSDYTVACRAAGHNETKTGPVAIAAGQTTVVDFVLTYPDAALEPASIEHTQPPDTEVVLAGAARLANSGNGALAWEARVLHEGFGQPWELLDTLALDPVTGNSRHLGAEFDGDYFWVAAGDPDASPPYFNRLYRFDSSGAPAGSYGQGTYGSAWGMRDLAFDGQFLHGGDEDGFYRIDPATGATARLFAGNLGLGVLRGLAHYPPNDTFIGTNWGGPGAPLVEFDRQGNVLRSFGEDWSAASLRAGLAYDEFSAGGPFLWVFDQGAAPAAVLHQAWIEEPGAEVLTGVTIVVPPLPGAGSESLAGGLFVAPEYAPGMTAIGGVVQQFPEPDLLFVLALAESCRWLAVEPAAGTLAPGGEQPLDLRFASGGLFPGSYAAVLRITSDDGDEPELDASVTLHVSDWPPTPSPTASPESTPPPGSPTPLPTGPGTPSPEPTASPELGVTLELPLFVSPGDVFEVAAVIENPGPALADVPLFVVLEAFGEFYFWPSWSRLAPPGPTGIDYLRLDLPAGRTGVLVLPPLAWPDTGTETVRGLRFWAAMLDDALAAVRGRPDMVEWGYGPG